MNKPINGSTDQAKPPSRRAQRYQQRQHNRQLRLFIGLGAAVVAIILAAVGLTNLHHGQSAPAQSTSQSAGDPLPPVGSTTPNGTFTTLTGQRESVASSKGSPTLLWFVSTWCSSCQAGTKVMAKNLATLAAAGVKVKEIELYHDLGSTGPSMSTFAKVLAGSEFHNSDWTFGVSSLGLSKAYDPVGYLDIYYLINSAGKITYINSSPSATMPQLLKAVKGV
jgi:thiol-disulfide isomerase/thioredoxin